MKLLRRRRTLVIFIACTGLYLAVRAYLASADAGPQLVVRTTAHDFGQVTAGSVLQHEFTIENHGTTRIVIDRSQGACCGAGYSVLPAGGQVQIPVTLTAAANSGPVRRIVRVATSDSQRPQIHFTVTARVVKTDDGKS